MYKNQAENTISNTSIIQNKNILFMSFQVGITSLLRINKNMRHLNEHIVEQEKKIIEQDKKFYKKMLIYKVA